jgi:hypothetical protein
VTVKINQDLPPIEAYADMVARDSDEDDDE